MRGSCAIYAQGHSLHPAQDHRIEPFARLSRDFDPLPPRKDRRKGDLPLEAGEREAETGMRTESEGEMRHAVAPQVHAVGVSVGARVAVGAIHHEEYPVAALQPLLVDRMRLLHDAHLRSY